ncbi:MAG TPA: hypothetical protein VN181_01435 [Thermoanaerobaculia bacterium]|nr:hypothetical protein [Thermoanaerobaculia bacterium]
MSAERAFRKIQLALDEAGVPYMVTGSFASSVHGEPRASKDIDIVIAPTREQLIAFIRLFPPDQYYAQEEDALDAMAHTSIFNIIDFETGWRIDFIFRRDRPFSLEEFNRRRVVDVAGLRLFVAAPEDILIAKLEWAKMGESERQLEDAANVLRIQRDSLDFRYVERWVRELELTDQWEAAKTRAL